MSELDIQRRNQDRLEGPLSMSETDLLALEQQHDDMLKAAKRVREHLSNCPHSDQKTLDACDLLLKHIGIHDRVVPQKPAGLSGISKAEMAVYEGE